MLRKPFYDIAIVGGGVMGMSIAYHLSESLPKSASICILERDYQVKNILKMPLVIRICCSIGNPPRLCRQVAFDSSSRKSVILKWDSTDPTLSKMPIDC